MTATDLETRTYRSFDALPFDGLTWDALVAAGDTSSVFLTYGWQRAWWQTFGRGQLLMVVVADGERPTTIAPFFVDAGMAFLVGSGGSDQLDVIGSTDVDAIQAILHTLWREVPDLLGVHLYHVPDTSATGALVLAACARAGFECHDEGELPAPVLDMTRPGAAEEAAAKKKLVQFENWFRREGTLTVEHLREPSVIHAHLDGFFDQHIERWATTQYPSLFLDPVQRAFYRRVVDEVGPTGALRFAVLSWNGDPIAYHFGACHHGTFLYYKPSFRTDLARRSPGVVLLRCLLLEAVEEGVSTFDFGLGDEEYKQRFATATPLMRNWGIYPTEAR